MLSWKQNKLHDEKIKARRKRRQILCKNVNYSKYKMIPKGEFAIEDRRNWFERMKLKLKNGFMRLSRLNKSFTEKRQFSYNKRKVQKLR